MTTHRFFIPVILVVCLTLFNCSSSMETAILHVNEHEIIVELAITQEEQALGLMHRNELDENKGMLFIYKKDKAMNFWMKNTLIPLDIAYIDSNGIIREIYQMKPLSRKTISSKRPLRYALEMNEGYFEAHGIGVGDKVEGLDLLN